MGHDPTRKAGNVSAAGTARTLASVAATDTGRGMSRLMLPVADDLARAASMILGSAPNLRVGILTGFFIPRAQPPAAETDGPLGAVQIASLINALGGTATLISDSRCAPFIEGFIEGARSLGAGWRRPELLSVDDPEQIDLDVTHVVSIERPGRTADGSYRNIFAVDISEFCPPLDDWFDKTMAPKIAIGDGGNEVGMGRLDSRLVAEVIDQGAVVRSVVSADALIVAGTSNWGAHALCAAILGSSPQSSGQGCLSEAWCKSVLEAGVSAGAVDGVSAARSLSVDGLPWDEYWEVPRRLNQIAIASANEAPASPR